MTAAAASSAAPPDLQPPRPPALLAGPVLGIETSCDETAAAVVAGDRLLSMRMASQVPIHQRFGGVVPEVASRNHLLSILPTIDAALSDAGLQLADLAGIAVTTRPGLIGALLVGVQTAATLAWRARLPLVGVDHIHAHCWAAALAGGEDDRGAPPLPWLALAVSGGHTSLLRVDGPSDVETLAATLDDAAGEALDKVGKLLGLPYPAGPAVEQLARAGDPRRYPLPRGMRGRQALAFSFSGVKTAARQQIDAICADGCAPSAQERADLCASLQEAVVAQLVTQTTRAMARHGLQRVVLAGGVAANGVLRATLREAVTAAGGQLWTLPPRLCTDNGAMVAALGSALLRQGDRLDPMLADATPTRREPLAQRSAATRGP